MIERIFKAYDVRGIYPDTMSEDSAWKVGYATALYLQRSRLNSFSAKVALERTIVVGRDTRAHSLSLSAALIEGIRAAGTDVIDLGMVDSPLVYFAINSLDCVAGIEVTASHYPANYNGLKISGPKARPIGAATGLEDIRRIASTLRVGRTGVQATLEQRDMWGSYRQHVLRFLSAGKTIRIGVDASNGTAGWMIPAVFDGATGMSITPLHFETTGDFAHEPNPLVEANLAMLRDKVLSEKLDLGVCFDGDADCCVFVDELGNSIRPDLITAIIARDILSRPENAGGTIVSDTRSSRVVAEEIVAGGGKPFRERAGNSFVNRALCDNEAVFGGTLSGHYYFRNSFCTDSAAIAMAQVVSILSNQTLPLSELVRPLQRYAQTGEMSFQIDDPIPKFRDIADKYRRGKIDYFDGVSVDMGDCWFNLRKSNTEPLLRLNVECADSATLAEKLADLKAILGEPI